MVAKRKSDKDQSRYKPMDDWPSVNDQRVLNDSYFALFYRGGLKTVAKGCDVDSWTVSFVRIVPVSLTFELLLCALQAAA